MGAIATMLLGLFLLLPLSSAQQVGSFFTAIYLNGAPLPASQVSCSGMGQASYCCNTGTTCEWDDAGHVACCASGDTCEGSPYSSGASEGVYQTQAETTTTTECQCESEQPSTIAPEPTYVTTTVYQQPETTTTVAPVPESTTTVYSVAPAPVLEVTTSYAPAPSPETTTVTEAPQEVETEGNCAGGYTTLTDAGVGAPVKTVGCDIIFNSGGRRVGVQPVEGFVLEVLGILGMALWWR